MKEQKVWMCECESGKKSCWSDVPFKSCANTKSKQSSGSFIPAKQRRMERAVIISGLKLQRENDDPNATDSVNDALYYHMRNCRTLRRYMESMKK